MATATKKPTPVQAIEAPTGNVQARIAPQIADWCQASEEYGFKAHDEGRDLLPDERHPFRVLNIGDVDNQYGRRVLLSRFARVRDSQAKAGSKAEFEAADKAFNDAIKAERDEAADTEAKIRELQARLDRLVSTREQAEAKLSGMMEAREQLRAKDILPKFVVDRYHAAAATGDANAEQLRDYYVSQL